LAQMLRVCDLGTDSSPRLAQGTRSATTRHGIRSALDKTAGRPMVFTASKLSNQNGSRR